MSIYTKRATYTDPENPLFRVGVKYLAEERWSVARGKTLKRGWYYYWLATTPTGEELAGQVNGPHLSAAACLLACGIDPEDTAMGGESE